MEVLLFQTHVDDKKHGLEFDKDRISYRRKTFDAILSKEFKAKLTKVMLAESLKYPVALDLGEDDYFTKIKTYVKTDGTKGTKRRVTILNARSITQGKFENKSLDDIVDEYEASNAEIYAAEMGDEVDED